MSLNTTPGAADAEAYASVAEFTAHCEARGIVHGLTDTQIEQRLRLGADYLGAAYRPRWAGKRASTTQALDWPRYDVPMRDGPGAACSVIYYPSDEIPGDIKRANIEAALRAASDLMPDEGQAVKSETVGPISVTYQDWSRATRSFPAIDRLLEPYLAAGGGVRLTRS